MTSYRRRLDTTTNWAISFASGAIGIVLGSDAVPHLVALLVMLLLLFFLVLEADRFRHFEMSRLRVRMLERGFFIEALNGSTDEPWIELLTRDLRAPKPPLGLLAAMGFRLRRTYLLIFVGVLCSWLLKLELITRSSGGAETRLALASVGPIPGLMVVVAIAIFYASLVIVAVSAPRHYQPVDES